MFLNGGANMFFAGHMKLGPDRIITPLVAKLDLNKGPGEFFDSSLFEIKLGTT